MTKTPKEVFQARFGRRKFSGTGLAQERAALALATRAAASIRWSRAWAAMGRMDTRAHREPSTDKPATYTRHRLEETVLYQVVEQHVDLSVVDLRAADLTGAIITGQ